MNRPCVSIQIQPHDFGDVLYFFNFFDCTGNSDFGDALYFFNFFCAGNRIDVSGQSKARQQRYLRPGTFHGPVG
jgi:hypothetical protein